MKTGKPKIGLYMALHDEKGNTKDDPETIKLFLKTVSPEEIGYIVIDFFKRQLEEDKNIQQTSGENIIPFKKRSDK